MNKHDASRRINSIPLQKKNVRPAPKQVLFLHLVPITADPHFQHTSFQVLTLEFWDGARAQVQGIDLVVGT